MRTPSLAKPAVILLLVVCGCARKGDPVPAPPVPPAAPAAAWASLRTLEVTLPSLDAEGGKLRGLDAIRVLYLPLGLARPTAADVFSHGEIIRERRRPGLPGPGEPLQLDLAGLKRPAGWLVVVVVRAGQVPSAPSPVLPWLNPDL
ncbi:MAG TPA: hypothetical protein VFM84_05200 [Holophagaceae bacterium]|nr:hypothetical protein [Holophagaceae bacterium]